MGNLPANILAIAVAVTLMSFFAACQVKGVAVTWYMEFSAVVLSVFMAYASFGEWVLTTISFLRFRLSFG